MENIYHGDAKKEIQEKGVRDGWNGEDEAMSWSLVPCDPMLSAQWIFFSELKTKMSITTSL